MDENPYRAPQAVPQSESQPHLPTPTDYNYHGRIAVIVLAVIVIGNLLALLSGR